MSAELMLQTKPEIKKKLVSLFMWTFLRALETDTELVLTQDHVEHDSKEICHLCNLVSHFCPSELKPDIPV